MWSGDSTPSPRFDKRSTGMKTFLARLKEPSTWAGLATVIALTGWVVSPEQWQAISSAVIAVIAAYEILRPEKK